MISTALALLAFSAWLGLGLAAARSGRATPRLAEQPPDPAPPPVSAVVPCRDEAPHVEAAVRSLLSQDLPGLEVVAVDDRSSDATGAILDRLAAEDARLTVVHLTALPDGWLGKNHACAAGAERCRGEWILFTDGDVVFAPGALRRALGFARARGLGHLAAVPRLLAGGLLERSFVAAFGAFAAAAFRAWDLPRPGTRGFVGIGAFNLVRRDAYLAVGGHRRLALEVVDDVKLGLLLRRRGVPQGVVNGGAQVAVRWQHGFLPSALGLVKNAFATVEYRPALALLAAGWALFLGAGPPALLLLSPGLLARALAGAALALSVLVLSATARRVAGGNGAEGLLMPAMAASLGLVLLGSAVAAIWRGGVVWRGTFYPLARLRAGTLREAELPAAGAAGWPEPPAGTARRDGRAAP